jgi:hypothetical protein
MSEENVNRIRESCAWSPCKSLSSGSCELSMPQTTLWRVLRKRLVMIAYRLQLLQALTLREILNRVLPPRWIGRHEPNDSPLLWWPLRSPDLVYERHCLRATIAQESTGAAESNCGCFGWSDNGYVAVSLARN